MMHFVLVLDIDQVLEALALSKHIPFQHLCVERRVVHHVRPHEDGITDMIRKVRATPMRQERMRDDDVAYIAADLDDGIAQVRPGFVFVFTLQKLVLSVRIN